MGGREEGKGKKEGNNQVWERWKRYTEDQETEHMCVAMGYGELGVATRKTQVPGKLPRPPQG